MSFSTIADSAGCKMILFIQDIYSSALPAGRRHVIRHDNAAAGWVLVSMYDNAYHYHTTTTN